MLELLRIATVSFTVVFFVAMGLSVATLLTLYMFEKFNNRKK